MSEKHDVSIEHLLANFSGNPQYNKQPEWSINDFNNVETADRKLIVNQNLILWIHEEALSLYSDLFKDLFAKSEEQDDEDIKVTELSIPHDEVFFDILLWIYTKDSRKLQKAGKTFNNLLYLISLGIFLRMKAEFFEVLLSNTNVEWKNEYFENPLWSRTIFTYPILARMVEDMKASKFTKVIALLSWLKDVSISSKEKVEVKPISEEIITSTDLYLVRNYIKYNKLMINMNYKELMDILFLFPDLQIALDSTSVINDYLFASKMLCIVCKKEFDSPQEVMEYFDCQTGFYHPKAIVPVNKNDKLCLHEGCTKKLAKNEYPCCHKPFGSNGCCLGDGKHVIVIQD